MSSAGAHTSTVVLGPPEIEPDAKSRHTSVHGFARQYALPLHHPRLPKTTVNVTANDDDSNPHEENTLRRKTPNGTLNAGYDGTTAHLHPQKHQLLINEPHRHAPRPNADSNVKHTFLEHQRRQRANVSNSWEPPPLSLSPTNMSHAHYQSHAVAPRTSFPVMDSTLYQMPPQYVNHQPYHWWTVPSVIQPSYQHLGPTAPDVHGAGPYGPYWHDGTYVPYRPTAVRDPSFYHNHQYHHYHHHHGYHPHSFDNQWSRQHGTPPHALQQGPWQHSSASRPIGPPYAHSSPQHPNTLGNFPSARAESTKSHPYGLTSVSPRGGVSMSHSSSSQNVSSFQLLSQTEHQHDCTFAWALQQYRELLAFIHHNKRQQLGRHPHGHSAPSRSTFYPRPPKPSAFRSTVHLRRRRGDVKSHLRRPSLHESDESETTGDEGRAPAENSQPRMRTSHPQDFPKKPRLHGQDQRRLSTGSERIRANSWSSTAAHQTGSCPDDRSTSSRFPPVTPLPPLDNSPPGRAAAALFSMTNLCREMEWQWTDGMHLCGCLAFGLSDYSSALDWYTKVLDLDPKHLEATSNLAATLLALGRRQEAEQHWLKVVRAAPNHFEAVEHLIGLLCGDQRSRDAIKVIDYVETGLRHPKRRDLLKISADRQSESSSSAASRSPSHSDQSDQITYDFELDADASSMDWRDHPSSAEPGFGSSGFAIPGCDNGRILALIHAKGNMLYGLSDNGGAARAFEDAVMIAAGGKYADIQSLVKHILSVVVDKIQNTDHHDHRDHHLHHHRQQLSEKTKLPVSTEPILLSPEQALATANFCFPNAGELPGLQYIPGGPHTMARKAVISTTSNSLLSLAKIFQDGMSNSKSSLGIPPLAHGVRDVLALYYLSLSLQPSPSTANNVGILLASVQQTAPPAQIQEHVSQTSRPKFDVPGVAPGSGIALALQYYNYGLQLDQNHAHLYTNLGSLLKDIGQLDAAISMYERAVICDGKFDIALANLANAVKDKGRISDAIVYYKRAVEVNPDFAEAVCGLANALNSVCGWQARGGIADNNGQRDRWHVDAQGMLIDGARPGTKSTGWIKRVVEIVEKQLTEGESWGSGVLTPNVLQGFLRQIAQLEGSSPDKLLRVLGNWSGQKWEGARATRLTERATRRVTWHWYRDAFVDKIRRSGSSYDRPQLPEGLTPPAAPTVLPFHTFTSPMSAKQIRLISQRNGLRISVSTLRSPWLHKQVYPPPRPPEPYLRIGYISSDFNNHPLAHLMQSVFGLHNRGRVKAYCYATTASDDSVHRRQIQAEAPVFHDASGWSAERLVNEIVKDQIHILVNLNGYTRGARNEVFAARPAPIQMSFMGFAGSLGAEWCDYLLADETAVPRETLRPWRRNVDLADLVEESNADGNDGDWIYGENIIYCRDTFFCCDHRQSAPDAQEPRISWEEEEKRRWQMRKELFPQLSDDTIIFGNFNQLYKIEPTTFRTWLRILARVPKAILWLLRFPDLGELHLSVTAQLWAGAEVAARVVFTDVVPKHLHISRACICDVVLDTAECNAHTTAADVLWSGTPVLTLPRYSYKMCSRMAASILQGALPKGPEGDRATKELIATHEDDYEEKAVALGKGLVYTPGCEGRGQGRLLELRRLLFEARWTSALFDTKRWVSDLEDAYEIAWQRWVEGQGGDIYLDQFPRSYRPERESPRDG